MSAKIVFATASKPVVERAINHFKNDELYILVPYDLWDSYSDMFKMVNTSFYRISKNRFHDLTHSDLHMIQSLPIDSAVIVSGGVEFFQFYNVVDIVKNLLIGSIIFYNVNGECNTYICPKRLRTVYEKFFIPILINVFLFMNRLERLLERTFL
jgi:hypothetical protein